MALEMVPLVTCEYVAAVFACYMHTDRLMLLTLQSE
jgi:hypothetical protein